MKTDYSKYNEVDTPEIWARMDEEAKTFNKEFVPLYEKYIGTKRLRKIIKEYIETHEIKRREDFQFQLTCMWCDHIKEYRKRNNIPFKAEDIFAIRIPDFIRNMHIPDFVKKIQ